MTSTGPVFGEFLVNIALLLKAFTDTGGIQLFFDILNKAASILVAVFSNEIVQKVFLFLAAVKGVTLAFGALYTISRFAFLAILGNLIAMVPTSAAATGGISALRVAIYRKTIALNKSNAASAGFLTAMKSKLKEIPKLIGALRLLGGAWLTATWPVLLIVAAIAVVAGAFYMMYKNSEDLRKAVSELGKALKDQLLKSWETIKGALEKILPKIGNVSESFKAMGDFIARNVMPHLQTLLTFIMKLATFFIVTFIGSLTTFINYIRGFVGLWTGLFEAIRTGSFDPLEKAFEDFVNGIIDGVNTLIDALNILNPFSDIPYIDYIGDAKTATDKLKDSTVPLTDAQEDARRKMEEAAAAASGLYDEFGSLKDIQATIRTEIETTFDKFTEGARSIISARDAAKGFKEETDKLNSTMSDKTLKIDQKKDALYQYADSVLNAIKKDIELGGTQETTTDIMNKGRDAFVKAAGEVGIFETEAKKLADSLALTPATITKTFKASGLGDLQSMVESLQDLEVIAGNANTREGRGNFSSTQYTQIKAEISAKLSLIRGETSGKPLFVEVTNTAKAVGGPVSANKTYMVGEKGPELFTSNSAGKITPNGQLGNMSGNSAPTIIVNPSQGMDEVELAHNVSRQLAWSMRRGA
jgi:hypothetical protein